MSEAIRGEDGRLRCPWGLSTPDYVEYHDTEWGKPVHGDVALYERISLEAFQSGLSWITILRRREGFRRAFDGFDPEKVAAYDDSDVARLLADEGIIRNRAKVLATIANARALLELDGTTLDSLVWGFAPDPAPAAPTSLSAVPAVTPESTALAKELKRKGFRFVGPTTAYALMQACGLVNDHLSDCFAR
ncbi:DNA-3-methyladenine glycosylase I [Streptacidiphilus jiangxiensis]|uniref:DNA-3-methyladenine glycosylase I n=1 Tax=Streptacidiphilus jiangxiensis TaxID=235985 RepID=A0A1H7FZG0_STRJI|nr:DNA-3-methyladenine glycosylase I [Streptacidiphilus jiangxiensis]SEK28805.1 DNA-3-methyladenine glycosylase I [Streptacidiphilus jiangxiensis]